MVDTYLQPEVHIVITQVPGVDGISSPAQLAQIEADLATALARPEISTLDDVPDVDVAGAVAGNALVYDDVSNEWQAGSVQSGIYRVWDWADELPGPISGLQTVRPVRATPHPGFADRSRISVDVGTTSETVAAGDHTHRTVAPERATFPASTSLSSGARTLVSGTVTGLDADKGYRYYAMLVCDLRGEGTGAGYTLPRIALDGVTQARFGQVRTVAGVDRELVMWHAGGSFAGGRTSFPYSATITYAEGDPVYVGAGELFIIVVPNR